MTKNSAKAQAPRLFAGQVTYESAIAGRYRHSLCHSVRSRGPHSALVLREFISATGPPRSEVFAWEQGGYILWGDLRACYAKGGRIRY